MTQALVHWLTEITRSAGNGNDAGLLSSCLVCYADDGFLQDILSHVLLPTTRGLRALSSTFVQSSELSYLVGDLLPCLLLAGLSDCPTVIKLLNRYGLCNLVESSLIHALRCLSQECDSQYDPVPELTVAFSKLYAGLEKALRNKTVDAEELKEAFANERLLLTPEGRCDNSDGVLWSGCPVTARALKKQRLKGIFPNQRSFFCDFLQLENVNMSHCLKALDNTQLVERDRSKIYGSLEGLLKADPTTREEFEGGAMLVPTTRGLVKWDSALLFISTDDPEFYSLFQSNHSVSFVGDAFIEKFTTLVESLRSTSPKRTLREAAHCVRLDVTATIDWRFTMHCQACLSTTAQKLGLDPTLLEQIKIQSASSLYRVLRIDDIVDAIALQSTIFAVELSNLYVMGDHLDSLAVVREGLAELLSQTYGEENAVTMAREVTLPPTARDPTPPAPAERQPIDIKPVETSAEWTSLPSLPRPTLNDISVCGAAKDHFEWLEQLEAWAYTYLRDFLPGLDTSCCTWNNRSFLEGSRPSWGFEYNDVSCILSDRPHRCFISIKLWGIDFDIGTDELEQSTKCQDGSLFEPSYLPGLYLILFLIKEGEDRFRPSFLLRNPVESDLSMQPCRFAASMTM